MSVRRLLTLASAALVVLVMVFGCTFGGTIQGRIDDFLSDLNSTSHDWVYQNLDPSLADYEALKDGAYWDVWFPLVDGGSSYTFLSQTVDDPGTGTATVTAQIDGPDSFSGPWTIVIGLVMVDLDWYIRSITLGPVVVVPYISGVTIQGTIDQFLEDLNAASRDQLYLSLDPLLANYTELQQASYWDGWFPLVDGGTPYALTGQTIDDSGVTTATVTASINGPAAFFGPKDLEMKVKKIGLYWKIYEITLGVDPVIPYNP